VYQNATSLDLWAGTGY